MGNETTLHVLFVQENQDARDKFAFFVESTYNAVVYEARDLKKAEEILRNTDPAVSLIIMDGFIGGSSETRSFWKKVADTPSIFCLNQKESDIASSWGGTFRIVDRDSMMDQVFHAIDDFIESGLIDAPKVEEPQIRIRTRLLLSVGPLKGDVYIRLSTKKFVKLFREGDTFDQQDLEKYTIRKGVEYLYIRKEQCKEFAEKLKSNVLEKMASEDLTIKDVFELSESVHEAVQSLVKHVGFSKDVQELVRTEVKVVVKSMGKDPTLADIIKKIQGMEAEYISGHSVLTAYLASALAVQLQWGSSTTFQKLTLAAFAHDITLENQELAKLSSLDELEANKKKFKPKELKDFKDHPIEAAAMVQKMSEIPPDVDTIIRQHHEKPDGSGFPGGLEHNYIAPLASVFIIAHDLAKYSLDAKENFNIEAFLQGVRDQYKSSYFRKILACLETLRKF